MPNMMWRSMLLALMWAGLSHAQGIEPLPVGDVLAASGSVALSADGRVAAHVDAAGSVHVWDPTTAKVLKGVPGVKRASAVALSRDGRWLAVGQEDGRLQLWPRGDARSTPQELKGHAGRITTVTFSQDDHRVASGSDDGTTQVFDVVTGQRQLVLDSLYNGHSIEGVARPVTVAFAAGGQLLLAQDWRQRQYDSDRITSVWELLQGVEVATREATPPNDDSAVPTAAQAVGGGGWLWAYSGAQHLMVQRLDGCAAERALPPQGYADAVAVDPLGRWVADGQGRDLNIVGMAGGEVSMFRLPGRVLALLPQSDGRSVLALLASWGPEEGAYARRPGSDQPVQRPAQLYRVAVPTPFLAGTAMGMPNDTRTCKASDTSRRAQQFISAAMPRTLAAASKLAPMVPPLFGADLLPLAPSQRLRFVGTGQLLALYTGLGDVRASVNVWNLADNRTVLARSLAYQSETPPLAWLGTDWVVNDADGGWVLATTGQRLLEPDNLSQRASVAMAGDAERGRLYRVVGARVEQVAADGQRLPDLNARSDIGGIAARNGRLFVYYRNGGFELFAGTPLASVLYRPPAEPRSEGMDSNVMQELMLSADGRYVQWVGNASNFETPDVDGAWRLAGGAPLGTGTALAALLARANRVVTHDSRAHRLAVWDFDRNELIARLPRQRSRDDQGNAVLLKAAISDDGRRIASASPDGLVRVWDIDARRLLGEARVGAAVTALAFDAPGRQLAVGRADGQVWVLNIPAP
jgi:hypothetical protein